METTSQFEQNSKRFGGKGKLTGKLINELLIYCRSIIVYLFINILIILTEYGMTSFSTLFHKILINENPQY